METIMCPTCRQPTANTVARWLAWREEQKDRRAARCWGESSDALAAYAVGYGRRPEVPTLDNEQGYRYPHDQSDLDACERTFEAAPAFMQDRMRPVMDEFRRWVEARTEEYA